MLTRCMHTGVAVAYLISGMLAAGLPTRVAAEPVVREQRTAVVAGVEEVWQLVWDGQPATVCGPEDISNATTCPCAGLAYGEHGKLSLVRRRADKEVERMDLRPLFGLDPFDGPGDEVKDSAYLQRWPLKDDDLDREKREPDLAAEIKQRPAPTIMTFADYDRDGRATEFLLQVGTLPCGKLQYAAIGVTKKNPRLHALTSVAHPKKPLVMPRHAWEALLKGPGPAAVTTITCGDHASENRGELVVSAKGGAIRVKSRAFSCPAKGRREKLIEETDE